MAKDDFMELYVTECCGDELDWKWSDENCVFNSVCGTCLKSHTLTPVEGVLDTEEDTLSPGQLADMDDESEDDDYYDLTT